MQSTAHVSSAQASRVRMLGRLLDGAIDVLTELLKQHAHIPARLCMPLLDCSAVRFLCLMKVMAHVLVESTQIIEGGRVVGVERDDTLPCKLLFIVLSQLPGEALGEGGGWGRQAALFFRHCMLKRSLQPIKAHWVLFRIFAGRRAWLAHIASLNLGEKIGGSVMT